MMKRRIFSLLLALALICTLGFSVCAAEIDFTEDGDTIYDEANLLSRSEEANLAELLADLGKEYDTQILIVTVDETDGDPDDYVEDVYDTMDFGYGSSRSGVLLLVCMDVREYRILSNGDAADAIDPDAIDQISDAIVDDLSDGDYAQAFEIFAEKCAYYLDGYENGFPFAFGKTLLTALVVGIVVGLIVVAILAAQLKSVKKKDQARDYIRPGSMQLTVCHDLFLYRNVQRTKKESSSSSSSRSSSSRHVGGGRF